MKLLEYKPEAQASSFAEQQLLISEEKSTMLADGDQQFDDSVQACVMPHQPASNSPHDSTDKSNPNCNISSATVIGNGKSHQPDGIKALKIVGGYKNKLKQVECNMGVVGPCQSHKSHVFDVPFKSELVGTPSDSSVKFNAKSIPFYKIFDNGTIFPWDARTASYKINANTCGKKISQEIIVYPDVKIEIDIPFEFTQSETNSVKLTQNALKGRSDRMWETSQRSEELKISAKYKEDGTQWKVSAEINEKFKKVKDFVQISDGILGTLQRAFDDTIKVEFSKPAGSIHFDFEWKEYGYFEVDSEWNALIKINPLIGAKGTIELDQLILSACTGPIAKVYSKVKKAIQKSEVAKIAFQFIAQSELSLNLGLTKKVGSGSVGRGSGLEGKIEFTLKASGSIKVQIIISVEATAEVGVKTGVKGSAFLSRTDGFRLDYKIDFIGVNYFVNVKNTGGSIRKYGPSINIEKPIPGLDKCTIKQDTIYF